MYKIKLENEGYDVHTASNGLDGFELVKTRRPELVLLDLRMPHMNGDEMLEHMRATQWGKDISVIIAANVNKAHLPWRLHLLDFDHYIIKAHYTPKQILELIQEVLAGQKRLSA